jgi:hypothetical protein
MDPERAKEDAMYGTAVILIMLVLRVVIPVGLLLCVGEIARRRNPGNFHPISSQL